MGKKKYQLVVFIIAIAGVIFFSLGKEDRQIVTTEQQLANILAQIDGIGNLSVFIYKEEPITESFTFFSGGKGSQPAISGILIVCEGAKNIAVQQQLKEVIYSLTQVPVHRIVIQQMSMKEK